jgi:hypothetical protein
MSNLWLHLSPAQRDESEAFAKDLMTLYRSLRFSEPLDLNVVSRLSNRASYREETVGQLLSDSLAIKEQLADELRRQAQQLALPPPNSPDTCACS